VCAACGKTAYVMERVQVEGEIFHAACFKCTFCNGKLSLGSFAKSDGRYYCKIHYEQLFKVRGRYDFKEDPAANQDSQECCATPVENAGETKTTTVETLDEALSSESSTTGSTSPAEAPSLMWDAVSTDRGAWYPEAATGQEISCTTSFRPDFNLLLFAMLAPADMEEGQTTSEASPAALSSPRARLAEVTAMQVAEAAIAEPLGDFENSSSPLAVCPITA